MGQSTRLQSPASMRSRRPFSTTLVRYEWCDHPHRPFRVDRRKATKQAGSACDAIGAAIDLADGPFWGRLTRSGQDRGRRRGDIHRTTNPCWQRSYVAKAAPRPRIRPGCCLERRCKPGSFRRHQRLRRNVAVCAQSTSPSGSSVTWYTCAALLGVSAASADQRRLACVDPSAERDVDDRLNHVLCCHHDDRQRGVLDRQTQRPRDLRLKRAARGDLVEAHRAAEKKIRIDIA
jgi:hypothetical protein